MERKVSCLILIYNLRGSKPQFTGRLLALTVQSSPLSSLYNRAQEDWGRKRKCSQEHNGTVCGTFERSFLSFFLPIFGWDMTKNLNDISTLFSGVTYTRIMASKEEKVRKSRSRHAYVRHEMNAAITKRVKTAVETCRWWKTTHSRCFTGFRDDLCCQNTTLENKKAIRDDKLTRVLGEGKCFFIDIEIS